MEAKTRSKPSFSISTEPSLQTWLCAQLHDSFYDKCLFSGWDVLSLLARSLGLATERRGIGTESKASESFCRAAPEEGKMILGPATPNLGKCLINDERSCKSTKWLLRHPSVPSQTPFSSYYQSAAV